MKKRKEGREGGREKGPNETASSDIEAPLDTYYVGGLWICRRLDLAVNIIKYLNTHDDPLHFASNFVLSDLINKLLSGGTNSPA